jgi:hypothetical protein
MMHLDKNWPEAFCSCFADGQPCVCPPMERALRAWKLGATMPAMTPEQRSACLGEISSIEGYDRAEHEDDTDRELAHNTLCAWTDYARDQGMIS